MNLKMSPREKRFKIIIFCLFLVFFIWFLLQLIAPLTLPSGSVRDLSGLVAVSDNEHIIQEMGFPWNSMYTAGDRLCHQLDHRSFFLNGNQMPFCSRCTAIWLGLVLGLGLFLFFKINLSEKMLIVFVMCLFPIGVDGVGQLFGLWESTNLVRFTTGLLVGVVSGLGIGIIIKEMTELLPSMKKGKPN